MIIIAILILLLILTTSSNLFLCWLLKKQGYNRLKRVMFIITPIWLVLGIVVIIVINNNLKT